jgi:hypothetical protein
MDGVRLGWERPRADREWATNPQPRPVALTFSDKVRLIGIGSSHSLAKTLEADTKEHGLHV